MGGPTAAASEAATSSRRRLTFAAALLTLLLIHAASAAPTSPGAAAASSPALGATPPQAQLMPAAEDAQLTQLALQCPASVRYEISLGQGPAAPQVPIFVAVLTLQNNVNVSGAIEFVGAACWMAAGQGCCAFVFAGPSCPQICTLACA